MMEQRADNDDEASSKATVDSTAMTNAEVQQGPTPVLSKNQLKRQRRLERLMKFKAEKRKRERELRKQKGKNNVAVTENADGELVEISRKSLKKNLMQNSSAKLRVVIDCSFEHLMNISDISHLGKQISFCYAINRRMTSPLQFYLTSMSGKTRELLEKSGLSHWDVHLSEKPYQEVFGDQDDDVDVAKEKLIYLTSDSSNELVDLDDSKVYIIGGLVDHNHHKALCYDLAVRAGIAHARLPIGKFMSMKTRSVLTVNQVFQIVAKYVECKDWKKAFVSALPKRKGAETLSSSSDDDNDDNSQKRPKPDETGEV